MFENEFTSLALNETPSNDFQMFIRKGCLSRCFVTHPLILNYPNNLAIHFTVDGKVPNGTEEITLEKFGIRVIVKTPNTRYFVSEDNVNNIVLEDDKIYIYNNGSVFWYADDTDNYQRIMIHGGLRGRGSHEGLIEILSQEEITSQLCSEF